MKILSNSERAYKDGPESWFTGTVWVNAVVDPAAIGGDSRLQAALVTFAPGARTAWHIHPRGQTLYVVSGAGRVQKEGEGVQVILPGDVVVIAAGESHWHGADATHTLVHLAMQETDERGTAVDWGKHVTDEEYRST